MYHNIHAELICMSGKEMQTTPNIYYANKKINIERENFNLPSKVHIHWSVVWLKITLDLKIYKLIPTCLSMTILKYYQNTFRKLTFYYR